MIMISASAGLRCHSAFIYSMLLISFSAAAADSTQGASWDQEVVDVRQGDNVTVTCTVTGVDMLSVVRLVHSHHSTSVMISDNDDVKSQFATLGRYRILYHIFDKVATLIVQITGIRGEDSGLLVCHQLGEDIAPAHVNIIVRVPIKELYVLQLTPDDEEIVVPDGSEVMLVQHDQHGIGCLTSLDGSFVEPNLNVSIGTRDVTELFHLSIERNPVIQESGLTLSVITVKRTLKTSQPDIEMNGQQITCIASVQSGYDDVTASALIVVQYAPIITCPKRVSVQSSDSVTLDCSVRANPGSTVTWSTPTDEVIGSDITMTFYTKALNAEESHVFLTIDVVLDRHFGNYTLQAHNLIGSSMATIELVPSVLSTTTAAPSVVYRLPMKQEAAPAASGNRIRSSTYALNQGTSSRIRLTIIGFLTVLSLCVSYL